MLRNPSACAILVKAEGCDDLELKLVIKMDAYSVSSSTPTLTLQGDAYFRLRINTVLMI